MTAELVALKDLIVNKKVGGHYSRDGGVPVKYLRGKQITNGTVDTKDIETKNVTGNISNRLLEEGDILFCTGGNFRCALVPKEAEGCYFSQVFVALTPDTTKISSQELYDCLTEESVQQAIRGVARGTVCPRISIKDLLELELPLPKKK